MPPKANGEIQVQKSPAEFFAENQAIAGFDNLGKSLYTSIRELVENALDACESIGELPSISVQVTEYTQKEFNQQAGIAESPRKNQKDTELFESKSKNARKKSLDSTAPAVEKNVDVAAGDGAAPEVKPKKRKGQDAYFKISVRDSGCGMQHDAIPNLFGRVLSGSKYGVRQTRGKFGLGAKMALIWAKKSTGQPIRIVTAHRPNGGGPPSHLSTCVLDIDIYKNEPKIIEHTRKPNKDNWTGTEVSVLIAGNWTTYKSRIVQYIQQLAVITPYADLSMTYDNASDPKRAVKLIHERRSEQMPPPAKEVKHHPSSVNNLVIQQLILYSKAKTLSKFLSTELSCVSPSIAKRLIIELGTAFDADMHPKDLTDKQITRLVQLLRQVQLFKAPDGSCLSPLGEYNLNLGIQKVLEPDLIATARDKVRSTDLEAALFNSSSSSISSLAKRL
jgi:DNA topoisomerase-6 subunit B